jgi:hypothetical protein
MSLATAPANTAPPVPLSQQPVSLLLSDMSKAHKIRMSQLKDDAAARQKTLVASSAAAAHALVESSNRDIVSMFNTESQIEQRLKEAQAATAEFHKKMAQWATLFSKMNQGLKEVGDVGHWAETIEVDMIETVRILEQVSAAKRKAVGSE